MKNFMLAVFMLLMSAGIFAQMSPESWYNFDPEKDDIMGVSSNRAYEELLKDKKAKPVVVAIIDGGTDIYHEDLDAVIWINEDEIPNNGIDDDNNGYIDDVHGWNFIGNKDGENLNHANLEVTRVFRMLNPKWEGKDSSDYADNEDFMLYLECKRTVEKEKTSSDDFLETLGILKANLLFADSILTLYFDTEDYTIDQVKEIKEKPLLEIAEFMVHWMTEEVDVPLVDEIINQTESEALYRYNVEFDPRGIIGDDWTKNNDPYYGNNDVKGPRAGHGTSVAGNVAAIRNNGKGPDGVTENAELMIIRVVPEGDEYDKDVANAILYAVNNGASIINMSFGKGYSPQKQFVDSALRVANEHDVLIIHAAGNEAENNDIIHHFPLNLDDNGNIINDKFLVVGASTKEKGKNLVAGFSNYGGQTVDLFAPGENIYSCEPKDGYSYASGTSMASPVATGVATIIRAYFPELSAKEVKDILMASVTKYDKKVYVPSADGGKPSKDNFSNLSISGGVINAYNAVKLAIEKTEN